MAALIVVKVRESGIVLRDGEWTTVMRKVVVIQVILPGGRGAPNGGRKGGASMVIGGGMKVGCGGGIWILIVADGLLVCDHGRWLACIIN